MPEVTITANVEVWCSCGNGLCSLAVGKDDTITVEPCPDCIEAAKKEGRDDGYEEGYDDGCGAGAEQGGQ